EFGGQRQAGERRDQAGQNGRQAEGQIALDIKGGEEARALMRFGLRQHGSHRAGEGGTEANASDDGTDEHEDHLLYLDACERDRDARDKRRDAADRMRRADELRSDSTAIAPLNVKALTTSPPMIGKVTPVATRTSEGISEK